jgi:8-oxo-dGTP pyrophosphatase MutT (NUDIX family)
MAGVSKSDSVEDPSQVAFLLIRARHPEDGKWVYLLQKRNDGTWGLPGGTAHVGEIPIETALRECVEEIGDLPPLSPRVSLSQRKNNKNVYIYLMETPHFIPRLNGSTPEETAGVGWFKRKEVGALPLHENFRKQWDHVDWRQIAKALAANENGEIMTRPDGPPRPHETGANWPYPHRADGTQVPEMGPDGEPPDWAYSGGVDDWSDRINSLFVPTVRGGGDAAMPSQGRTRNPAPGKPGPPGGAPSSPPSAGKQPPATSIGSRTGVSPGAKGSGIPVVGSVPATTPKPYTPTSIPPEAFDPADTVEHWSDEDESNTYVKLPRKKKG